MIFVTLGTHQPFDRLVQAVDAWSAVNPGVEVFGQVPLERGSYRPSHFEAVSHLHIEEYRARFQGAWFVVAHAGMGSIITALSLGKPIIIFPRRADLNEQRNDHQLATVKRFAGKPGIHVAEDRKGLIVAMDRLRQDTAPSGGGSPAHRGVDPAIDQFAENRFVEALREAIVPPTAVG